MDKEITEQDYRKFQSFLKFFVNQANKNAENEKAESPTKSGMPDFEKHYGLNSDYNLNLTKNLK